MDSTLIAAFVYCIDYPLSSSKKRYMESKEKVIKLSPAHEWYLSLDKDAKKVLDERYMIGEIANLKMDGKELIEYIYEQEVLNTSCK